MRCSRCNGTGKTSAHLGAFTADEMQEADEDFREDYVAGAYDRPCERCKGTGRVSRAAAEAWARQREDLRLQWQESGCPEGSFDKWAGG